MRTAQLISVLIVGTPALLAAQRSTTPIIPRARDSAGVRILEHAADALDRAPLLSLAPKPLAIIAKNDTTIDLSKVYSTVLVMRDNSVVFYVDGSVQVVSPDGARRQRIGRTGAGPKEFRDGDVARGRGDTILVTDLMNSRIALVTPGAGVVRMRALLLGGPGYSFGPIAQFDHDTLIMGTEGFVPAFTKPGKRLPFPVGRLIGTSDSIPIILMLEGGENAASTPAMYAVGGLVAVRYGPNPFMSDWGNGFLADRPDHWKLDLFLPSGKLAKSVRVPLRRTPITSALRNRDIELTVAANAKRSKRPYDMAAARTRYQAFPYEDSLPSFSDVKTTAGGIAWVREAALIGDTTWAYTAVALDGRILGRLAGTGHKPLAFGDDRVVLRDEDDDGVVTWRVMRINWGTTRP